MKKQLPAFLGKVSVIAAFIIALVCGFTACPNPAGPTASGVSLDQTSLTLTVGETASLAAAVAPPDAADKSVSWSSSEDTVATVDNTGTVSAVSPGTAAITVTTIDGGHTAECVVTVNVTAGTLAAYLAAISGDSAQARIP
jgi:uncharacterized protein YjdB